MPHLQIVNSVQHNGTVFEERHYEEYGQFDGHDAYARLPNGISGANVTQSSYADPWSELSIS